VVYLQTYILAVEIGLWRQARLPEGAPNRGGSRLRYRDTDIFTKFYTIHIISGNERRRLLGLEFLVINDFSVLGVFYKNYIRTNFSINCLLIWCTKNHNIIKKYYRRTIYFWFMNNLDACIYTSSICLENDLRFILLLWPICVSWCLSSTKH
jgi:hypothetical protein